MSKHPRAPRWLWGLGFGLVIVVVTIVGVLVHNRTPIAVPSAVGELSTPDVDTSVPPTLTAAGLRVEDSLKLPHLDFPPGSVEEACGLNEYVPYHYDGTAPWPKSPYNSEWKVKVFEIPACTEALEAHLSGINPYLWGTTDNLIRPFDFVVLENPLTFGRIFADPNGDFNKIQDALARPECLLQGDETNWELKESCHSDAFLNYALSNRFCFNDGVSYRKRTYYWEEDNPTPEQDRAMWTQRLEDDWVRMKCEKLNPTLELTLEQNPALYELVMSLDQSDRKKESLELLIELAARLGDYAAGLTEPAASYSHSYDENGSKYGRFVWLLESDQWSEFTGKELPSADRFQRVFNMLALVSARRPDPRDEIQFDWELVAQHLCTPPYYNSKRSHEATLKFFEDVKDVLLAYREEHENPKSCQEVVHEIRQQDNKFAPLLQALDKFEQVALELDVYE